MRLVREVHRYLIELVNADEDLISRDQRWPGMTRCRDTDLSPGGSREVDDLNQVFNATRVKRPLRATLCCAGLIRPGLMLTKKNLGRRLRGRGNFWHMRIRFHLSEDLLCTL